MHGLFRGKTIPQHVKHGAKRNIGLLPPLEVKLFSERLEPDVGLLCWIVCSSAATWVSLIP